MTRTLQKKNLSKDLMGITAYWRQIFTEISPSKNVWEAARAGLLKRDGVRPLSYDIKC